MTLRHAAALALVGWYMLGPPIGADNLLELNSPLSAWKRIGTLIRNASVRNGLLRYRSIRFRTPW